MAISSIHKIFIVYQLCERESATKCGFSHKQDKTSAFEEFMRKRRRKESKELIKRLLIKILT